MGDLERLAPWMYEFELPGGQKTPLLAESLRHVHTARRSMMFELLDAVGYDRTASVLDLACSEGYFSMHFAQRGAREVRGIDARPRNIEKAELMQATFGLTQCRFEVGDITEIELAPASYDIVLLLGIIYHVEDPIRLLRRAARAARKVLFVETQVTKHHPPLAFGWGSTTAIYSDDYWAMARENPSQDDLSSVRGFSLVPSPTAIVSLLREIGFRSIVQLHTNETANELQFQSGDRAMYAAWW